MYVYWPTILTALARFLNCVRIEGELRMAHDLEVLCYQKSHLVVTILIVVPGLIFYSLLPILAYK